MALTRQRQIGLILAIAGWAFTLFATLYPAPDQIDTAATTSIWCLVCGELGMVDVTLNLILFIPLGLGLGLLDVPWTRALLIIGLTTLTIEALQLSLVSGRDASLSDLLTNSLGGGIGFGLARRWRRILFPSAKASLVAAALGAALWIALQSFTAFAFERILPRSVYYGQWAPVLGNFERFTGRILSVRLDTIPLPGTRLARSDLAREALLQPASVLEVRAISGNPTADVAPIFSIFDDHQREIVLLGQDGQDLILRTRTRTAPMGLRSPALRLASALPSAPGEAITLRARYTEGHYHLEADVGGVSHTRDLALSASWGWTFLLPFDHAFGKEMPWLTTLWVAGLLLPVGYYAGRSGVIRGSTGWAALAGLLAIGLVLVPALWGLVIFSPLEWAAGIAGTWGGFRLGRGSRYRSTTSD